MSRTVIVTNKGRGGKPDDACGVEDLALRAVDFAQASRCSLLP